MDEIKINNPPKFWSDCIGEDCQCKSHLPAGSDQRPRMNKTIQLYDGDGLEILKSSKYFNFECCKCGLIHKITIEWKKKSVILRFETKEDASGISER